MPTVKDAMDTVALACAITVPSSWVASNTRTYQELKSILGIVIDEMLDVADWPEPIATDFQIVGDGSSSYDLPNDFRRLIKDERAVYDTTELGVRCYPVASNGAWNEMVDFGIVTGIDHYFRINGTEEDGYSIEFYPALETGETVTAAYISKNWLSINGTPASEWSDETATLRLPRRCVEAGVIWRWKQRKGLPYEDQLTEYEDYLHREVGKRRRNEPLVVGTQRFGNGANIAFPLNIVGS